MTSALSFAFFMGLVLGVIAARRVNQWPDTLISTLGPHLLRDAVVLVRPDGDRGVLDLPAMAAGRRLRGHHAGAQRPLAHARHRAPSAAAVADARADLPGDLSAHHARLDARGAEPRFRAHRALQGPRRDQRRGAPRAAQRAAADGDADRPAGRHDARRLGGGRERVLAAGARPARLRVRGAARPQHAARHRVRLGAARDRGQFHRRPRSMRGSTRASRRER